MSKLKNIGVVLLIAGVISFVSFKFYKNQTLETNPQNVTKSGVKQYSNVDFVEEKSAHLVASLNNFFKDPKICSEYLALFNKNASEEDKQKHFLNVGEKFLNLKITTDELNRYLLMDMGKIEINEADAGIGRQYFDIMEEKFCTESQDDFDIANVSESTEPDKSKFNFFMNKVITPEESGQAYELSIGFEVQYLKESDQVLMNAVLSD